MSVRSRDWNEGLARQLRDPAFAAESVKAALGEGIPLQAALGRLVRSLGVKEYAARVGMAPPNLVRALDPSRNVTQETLNRLLRPLGLRLSVEPIAEDQGRAA